MSTATDNDAPWQGGIPVGCVCKLRNGFQLEIRIDKGKQIFRKYFSASKYAGSIDRAKKAAEAFREQKSLDLGLTKNRWRRLDENTIEMRLTRNRTCIFDAENLERVASRVWRAWTDTLNDESAYAQTTTRKDNKRTTLLMHRFLFGFDQTDHISGDGLDNRRSNVRASDAKLNMNNRRLHADNTSGENGIMWFEKVFGHTPHYRFCWRENAKHRSKQFYVNRCGTKEATLEEAVKYRDEVVYPRIGNTNGRRPKRIKLD